MKFLHVGDALSPMIQIQMRVDCISTIRSSAKHGGVTGSAVGALGSGAYATKYNTSCVGIRITCK